MGDAPQCCLRCGAFLERERVDRFAWCSSCVSHRLPRAFEQWGWGLSEWRRLKPGWLLPVQLAIPLIALGACFLAVKSVRPALGGLLTPSKLVRDGCAFALSTVGLWLGCMSLPWFLWLSNLGHRAWTWQLHTSLRVPSGHALLVYAAAGPYRPVLGLKHSGIVGLLRAESGGFTFHGVGGERFLVDLADAAVRTRWLMLDAPRLGLEVRSREQTVYFAVLGSTLISGAREARDFVKSSNGPWPEHVGTPG